MTTTDAKPAVFEVRRGQTYMPCSPLMSAPSKPFLVKRVVGDRVEVWDPTGGQRMGGHRWVSLRNLHPSSKTRHGKDRQTGWSLHCDAPTDPDRQELCGACMTWVDRDQLAVAAWQIGHSTCVTCLTAIATSLAG